MLLVALVAAVLTAGCAASVAGTAGTGSASSCQPAAPAVTTPTADSVPILTIGASSPWSVGAWIEQPLVVFYADGSAIGGAESPTGTAPASSEATGWVAPGQPATIPPIVQPFKQLRGGYLDNCVLDTLMDEAVRLAGLDYGSLANNVYDASTRSFEIIAGSGRNPVRLDVYALGVDVDGVLSDAQEQARADLIDWFEQAEAAIHPTGNTGVFAIKIVEGSDRIYLPARDSMPVTWLADTPVFTDGCVVITGDQLGPILGSVDSSISANSAAGPQSGSIEWYAAPFIVDGFPRDFGLLQLPPGISC